MTTEPESLTLAKALLQRPIAFHRVFVTITGGAIPGLFLSQAWYWSQRTENPDGWFYKTQEEWATETGLVRSEQEHARRRLRMLHILDEQRRGVPARLFYRLHMPTLLQALRDGVVPTLPIDVQRFVQDWGTPLRALSKRGYKRAQQLNIHAEYVEYAAILIDHGLICGICHGAIQEGIGQRGDALTFDHILALHQGGTHIRTNVQPAHAQCNIAKDHTNTLNNNASLSKVHKLDCRATTNKPAIVQQPAYKDARGSETTTETTNKKTLSDAAACERRAKRDPRVVSVPETRHSQRQPQMQGYHLLDTTPWEDGPLLDYTCERYAAMFAEAYGRPHPRLTPKKLHALYNTLALAYDDAHLDVTEEEQIDELIVAHLATTTTDGKLYAFAMLHHLGFLALGHPEQPCTLHQDFIEELGDVRRQAAERKSRLQGVAR